LPRRDIVATWRGDHVPDDYLPMEFFADGTIIGTQKYGLVEAGEVEFVGEAVILVKLPELEYAAQIAVFREACLVHRPPHEGTKAVVFVWVESCDSSWRSGDGEVMLEGSIADSPSAGVLGRGIAFAAA